MKKPIIGISTSVIIETSNPFSGYERIYVNKDYVDAVIKNGAIPLMIPFTDDINVIKEQIKSIDGLILSGGHDVYPINYNEEPSQKLGQVFPERDLFDMTLLSEAKKLNLPILGICRGMQLINVAEGGSLYQDLSYIPGEVIKHSQNDKPYYKTHSLILEKGTKLHEIMGLDSCLINSFHHQTVKDVAPGFVVSGRAKDGVVEAIESINYSFLIGLQWHPEMLHKNDELANNIFKALISNASKGE